MLLSLLKDEVSTVTELLKLLKQEYKHLKTANAHELEKVVRLKEDCVQKLQRLVDRRVEYILQHGFSADAKGIEGFLNAVLAGCEEAKYLWEQLLKRTAQAQQQNDINGTALALTRSHVEAALSVLRGHEPGSYIYKPNAQIDSTAGNVRSLARA